MPNTAAIVVNNGTSDVTYSPDSVNSNHAVFQNLAVSEVNQRELLHFDRPANAKANEIRRSIRLNVPYEVTLSDGSVVTKLMSMKAEMVAPTDTTAAQRTALRVSMSKALVTTAAVAALDNPEWFW